MCTPILPENKKANVSRRQNLTPPKKTSGSHYVRAKKKPPVWATILRKVSNWRDSTPTLEPILAQKFERRAGRRPTQPKNPPPFELFLEISPAEIFWKLKKGWFFGVCPPQAVESSIFVPKIYRKEQPSHHVHSRRNSLHVLAEIQLVQVNLLSHRECGGIPLHLCHRSGFLVQWYVCRQ